MLPVDDVALPPVLQVERTIKPALLGQPLFFGFLSVADPATDPYVSIAEVDSLRFSTSGGRSMVEEDPALWTTPEWRWAEIRHGKVNPNPTSEKE